MLAPTLSIPRVPAAAHLSRYADELDAAAQAQPQLDDVLTQLEEKPVTDEDVSLMFAPTEDIGACPWGPAPWATAHRRPSAAAHSTSLASRCPPPFVPTAAGRRRVEELRHEIEDTRIAA